MTALCFSTSLSSFFLISFTTFGFNRYGNCFWSVFGISNGAGSNGRLSTGCKKIRIDNSDNVQQCFQIKNNKLLKKKKLLEIKFLLCKVNPSSSVVSNPFQNVSDLLFACPPTLGSLVIKDLLQECRNEVQAQISVNKE